MAKIDKVTILNYNSHYVFIPVENRTYTMTPAIDEDTPSQITIPFSEVEYVNGQSNCFRTGLLLFKHENPKLIYDALNIYDYDQIITNGEIKNILLKPTKEGLQKIIDIKDPSVFERVRAIFVMLKNSTDVDLSHRVIKIIDTRYNEFLQKKYNSSILVQPKDAKSNDIETEEVSALKLQLEEMKQMMAAILNGQNKSDNDSESSSSKRGKAKSKEDTE